MFRNLLKIAAATIVATAALGANVAAAGTSSSQLSYRGDWIQTTPKVYVLFWGDWSKNGDPYNVKPYLIRFYKGLGGSSFAQILTQYSMSCAAVKINCSGLRHVGNPGTMFVCWYTAHGLPEHPTTKQLKGEVRLFEKVVGDKSASAQYVIALPHRHADVYSTKRGACGWHSYTVAAGYDVSYTVMPYQPDHAGCGTNRNKIDGVTITAGHEFGESVTDPFLNSWISRNGKEIADVCEDADAGLVRFSTGTFAVQPLWSNKARACVYTA
jgi:hypothetical protein